MRVVNLASLILSALLATAVHAQSFPSKPVRLVVPFPAGGAIDTLARKLSVELSNGLGQPVIVDNQPGATGNIGTTAVARAAPDGHTVLMGSPGPLSIAPSLQSSLPFDPAKDFAPVAMLAKGPLMLVVTPSLPVASVKELIDYARANPGKLNFAGGGLGSTVHLAAELMKTMAEIDMVYVPYKGGPPAFADLFGGRIQVILADVVSAVPFMKEGRVRALAVTTSDRLSTAPNIPTISESGLPGFEASTWYGVLVPAKTPSTAVKRLQSEFARVLAIKEIQDWLLTQGAEPMTMSPSEFAAHIANERAKWARVVKAVGLKANAN
jgi:tripartite-type tricarboxylate transporter receptor subunit TctC